MLLTVNIFLYLILKRGWNILKKKMNSLEKGEGVQLLNFEGGPWSHF